MKIHNACALALAVILTACGGGGSSSTPMQIVSFGDSLSDVGTYAVAGTPPTGPLAFGGGRYTTNPGTVWAQYVGLSYGNTLAAAVQGGFGMAPVDTTGLAYAQGGAQVSTRSTSDYQGVLAQPITAQVDHYLVVHGKFLPNQIILLQGGGNDIVNAVEAAYGGYIAPAAVSAMVVAAATDLAATLDRIVAAGAQKIVLQNVADIGTTPLGVANPQAAADLSAMTLLFNTTLQTLVARHAQPAGLVMIDTYGWTADMLRNYSRNGFKVGNQNTACSETRIVAKATAIGLADPQGFVDENGLALLCSAATLTEVGADQSYMFADAIHPSSRLHELFGRYVVSQLAAKGI